MYISHISDLHITQDDNANLLLTKKLVSTINAFEILPDYTIVTGDLVHKNNHESYKDCFDALNELKMPYYIIGGNHDRATTLSKALEVYYPTHPQSEMKQYLQYEVDLKNNLSLIAIDYYGDQQDDHREETTRLDWLDEKLKADKDFIIIIHRFPLNTHLSYIEKNEKGWVDNFQKVIMKHKDKVKLIACGHLHNFLVSNIGGVPVISVGSHFTHLTMDFQDTVNHLKDTLFSSIYVHRFDDSDNSLVSYLVDIAKE